MSLDKSRDPIRADDSGKETLNVTISKSVGNALRNLLNERIKVDEKTILRTWDNKSALTDHLLKIGLVHYKQAREKDDTGGML